MSTGHEPVLGTDRRAALGRAGAPEPAHLVVTDGSPGQAPTPGRRGPARALLAACRPRQWVKNLLVLAAPAAAGVLGTAGSLGRALAAFGLFVAASSGTYLLNDTVDAEADRRHPAKRHRPIAAGELSPAAAVASAAVLLGLAVGLAPLVAGWRLAAIVGGYVVLTLAYSMRLKQVAFVELACLSLGFVLRAVGGAAATSVPVSPWFLVVTSAGALLLAAGKRSAELHLLGTAGGGHRRSLAAYPPWLLRAIRLVAAVVTVVGYVLWALWRGAHAHTVSFAFFAASTVPFAAAVAVLEGHLARGEGGAPEELALRSRTLQLLALACVAFVATGVYT